MLIVVGHGRIVTTLFTDACNDCARLFLVGKLMQIACGGHGCIMPPSPRLVVDCTGILNVISVGATTVDHCRDAHRLVGNLIDHLIVGVVGTEGVLDV